jgi:hypothetical protein
MPAMMYLRDRKYLLDLFVQQCSEKKRKTSSKGQSGTRPTRDGGKVLISCYKQARKTSGIWFLYVDKQTKTSFSLGNADHKLAIRSYYKIRTTKKGNMVGEQRASHEEVHAKKRMEKERLN